MENSSHFFASLQKPEALYESKVDLPKIESVSVAKIKPECFSFLNKNDQFVMYGATNEEQSLTYCIWNTIITFVLKKSGRYKIYIKKLFIYI